MAMNREQKRAMQKRGLADADGSPVATRERRQPTPKAAEARTPIRQVLQEIIAELRKTSWPTRDETIRLALIVSMDSFLGLPTWHEPERVLELATLVVAPREGVDDAPEDFLATHLPGVTASVVRLDGPHLRLSASEVRTRAAIGRSVRYLVPDAVAAYIGDHALYRSFGS